MSCQHAGYLDTKLVDRTAEVIVRQIQMSNRGVPVKGVRDVPR